MVNLDELQPSLHHINIKSYHQLLECLFVLCTAGGGKLHGAAIEMLCMRA